MYLSGIHRAFLGALHSMPGQVQGYTRAGARACHSSVVVFSCFSLFYRKFHPAPRTNFPNLPRKPPHTNRVLERTIVKQNGESIPGQLRVGSCWVGWGRADDFKGCPLFFFGWALIKSDPTRWFGLAIEPLVPIAGQREAGPTSIGQMSFRAEPNTTPKVNKSQGPRRLSSSPARPCRTRRQPWWNRSTRMQI